jgi:5-methyltetrahydrofolate--homocysteine methyltransferase
VQFSNTFNGNRIRLRAAGLADRCGEVNRAAVKLARAAAGPDGLIGGTIGPTGELLEPLGSLAPALAEEVFAEQAAALAEAGIDLFWIETMMALAEAEAAVAACRRAGDLPIAVTMSFARTPRGFFTMMGHGVEECVRRMESAGVAIVGANCQLASADMVELALQFRKATRLPLAMRPNAGQPELMAGSLHYPETSATFAEASARLADLGIELIGGCCGTTPAFIAAARESLAAWRAARPSA